MSWSVTAVTVFAAFGTYFCMYGFRKPFTAATYTNIEPLWGVVDFKIVLVIAQVFGYTVSKFIGIRYIAEVEPRKRVRSLLVQIAGAEIALLLFAVTPAPWNAIWMFVNGLMLGMIFGLVMGFLEGRRNTEALIAALCTSFIVADGVVKSVGSWLLEQGWSEIWMPFAAGVCFILPLVICAILLNRVPPPDAADVEARSERVQMNAADRRRFLRRYGLGLSMIVLMFLFVTILRSVRADFAPEIWKGLGVEIDSSLYSRSELLVAIGVIVLNGSMIFIRSNRAAFFAALGLSILGLILTAGLVQGLKRELIDPFYFMVLIGLGLYIPYIAVHTTIFERFIAMTRDRGTIGYLMYLADAFGYLGYVAVLLVKEFYKVKPVESMLPFFLILCTVVAALGVMMLVPAIFYFRRLRPAS